MIRAALLLTLFPFFLFAQPALKPHIGNYNAPAETDSICEIPVFQGNFDQSGYGVGDTVADFTLFTMHGDSFRLSEALSNGKPVLLVNGNYTCPRYRDKHVDLEAMADFYGSDLSVYVVYTVEAHPINDPSPYSGTVWVTNENYKDNILFPQPKTYGERLGIATQMAAEMAITVPILIDGPCNPWWSHFGPAPNNAYLIEPNGTVAVKHAWFHRAPQSMWCDLDAYLGVSSGHCAEVGNNGTFAFSLVTDSMVTGTPGSTLAADGILQNLSSTENVLVRIRRSLSAIPKDWETALCADICYTTDVDVTDITIGPGQTQAFTFYFYTGIYADSGEVLVSFTNINNAANAQDQIFTGKTEQSTATADPAISENNLSIYPNPGDGFYHLEWEGSEQLLNLEVSLMDGRVVWQNTLYFKEKSSLDLRHLPSGTYVLRAIGQDKSHSTILIKP